MYLSIAQQHAFFLWQKWAKAQHNFILSFFFFWMYWPNICVKDIFFKNTRKTCPFNRELSNQLLRDQSLPMMWSGTEQKVSNSSITAYKHSPFKHVIQEVQTCNLECNSEPKIWFNARQVLQMPLSWTLQLKWRYLKWSVSIFSLHLKVLLVLPTLLNQFMKHTSNLPSKTPVTVETADNSICLIADYASVVQHSERWTMRLFIPLIHILTTATENSFGLKRRKCVVNWWVGTIESAHFTTAHVSAGS